MGIGLGLCLWGSCSGYQERGNTVKLAEPRYQLWDVSTGAYLGGFYHRVNLATELRYRRRIGQRVRLTLDMEGVDGGHLAG